MQTPIVKGTKMTHRRSGTEDMERTSIGEEIEGVSDLTTPDERGKSGEKSIREREREQNELIQSRMDKEMERRVEIMRKRMEDKYREQTEEELCKRINDFISASTDDRREEERETSENIMRKQDKGKEKAKETANERRK